MKKPISAIKLDKNMHINKTGKVKLKWYSPKKPPFVLAGFPWFAKDRIYRRMPVKPAYPLSKAVDMLANHTSGGQIRFRTDSPELSIKVKLAARADMYHMPATGQCGFDCYTGKPGHMLYAATTRYNHRHTSYEYQLFNYEQKKMRNITINFPLYQGVKKVELGIPPGSSLLPPLPFRTKKPVVVYGTSVTQGGCVARPGMSWTNILSRRFNIEFINLGFSGNGKGEPEVARIIAGIRKPLCLVINYEGNCPDIPLFKKTFPEFIRILREAHPKVPILVISQFRSVKDLYDAEFIKNKRIRRAFQLKVIRNLRRNGEKRLFFQDGYYLLGRDFHECSVDGVHPTDLGFRRMADVLEPVFKRILF